MVGILGKLRGIRPHGEGYKYDYKSGIAFVGTFENANFVHGAVSLIREDKVLIGNFSTGTMNGHGREITKTTDISGVFEDFKLVRSDPANPAHEEDSNALRKHMFVPSDEIKAREAKWHSEKSAATPS